MAEIIALEQERLAGRLRQGVGKAVAIVQAGCVPRGSGSLIARLNTSPSSAGCHPLSAIARLSGKQQLCRVKPSIVHGAKMKALTRFAFVFALSLFAGAALAQQVSNDQAWVELKKLDWKYGPTQMSGCMNDDVISIKRRSLFPVAMILLVGISLLALAYEVGALIAQ
ncbi:hypothetical protein ACVI1J_000245 [Bradyrhizobium diazoefficiens]